MSKKKEKEEKKFCLANLVLQTLSRKLILADASTVVLQRIHLIPGSSSFHRTKGKEKGDALKDGSPKASHFLVLITRGATRHVNAT